MKILFVIGSVTSASRLKRELYKMGVKNAVVVNTPISVSTGGCSYSIEASESEKELIYEAAKRRKIKIKGVYRGEGEELENIS